MQQPRHSTRGRFLTISQTASSRGWFPTLGQTAPLLEAACFRKCNNFRGSETWDHQSLWRNWLARSAVNRKDGGSSPPRDGLEFWDTGFVNSKPNRSTDTILVHTGNLVCNITHCYGFQCRNSARLLSNIQSLHCGTVTKKHITL